MISFFEEKFLVANVSPDVVFEIPFFILSGVDVNFSKNELWWRSYTIKKALFNTKWVELVRKKEFAAAALHLEHKTFVVYVASFESLSNTQESDVHPSCRAQIAALVANEALTSIPTEYSNFANIFSPKLALEFPEYTGIHDHAIKLVDNWQALYGPIYSLRLIELETLKTYIKTSLANGIIGPSKSLVGASIFFDKKPNGSLQICINY